MADRPDAKAMAWFTITDFTAGIWDSSNCVAPGNTTPGPFSAPAGAADGTNTFGCMALPNGGLAPLPRQTTSYTLGDWGITGLTNVDISAITDTYVTSEEEIVVVLTTYSGPDATTVTYSYVLGTASLNEIGSAQVNNWDGVNATVVCFPFSTRVTGGGATNQPVLVIPYFPPDGPTGNLAVYPDLAATTTFALTQITADGGVAFGHQGRICELEPVFTSWPVTNNVEPNEGLSYTDPAQSVTWPQQDEYFGPENPFGYGAVSSVSAGELFMVKARGGAIIVQGDLNNPTVTTLPGVKSTGPIYGKPGVDINGMYYCVQNGGAWLWNGGNTSQKISSQLDNNSFVLGAPVIASNYYNYYCQRWGDWMMFSNNWVFNSVTGGWWKLDLQGPWYYYIQGFNETIMYTAVQAVANTSVNFMSTYDKTKPALSYFWQSLPIKFPMEDRLINVGELAIRASNPYADATPFIIPTIIDSVGNRTTLPTWHLATGTPDIQMQRWQVGVRTTDTVAIEIEFTGSNNGAGIIHDISVGYRARQHVGTL